jgi:hypothetical protein
MKEGGVKSVKAKKKKKEKLGLQIGNYKLYQLSPSFGLPFLSHLNLFSPFTKSIFCLFCDFVSFFSHFPPNPFCLHFFVANCELSTSFVWVSKVLS